jgi:hypothetical protein
MKYCAVTTNASLNKKMNNPFETVDEPRWTETVRKQGPQLSIRQAHQLPSCVARCVNTVASFQKKMKSRDLQVPLPTRTLAQILYMSRAGFRIALWHKNPRGFCHTKAESTRPASLAACEKTQKPCAQTVWRWS